MEEQKKYWFPAKPPGYGWGWGLPITWQGWVVFLSFFALIVGGSVVLALLRRGIFIGLWAALLAAVLISICYWKGEPPGPWNGGRGKPGR